MGSATAGENDVLDGENSSYFANLESIAANGTLSMTVTYAIKESASGAVSNMSLHLILPENAELNEETLRLDNILCTNYTYDESRTLTIPVTENSGTLKFCLKVTAQGALSSYASLKYTKDGVTDKKIIGILNDEANLLTLNAPEVTAKDTITVNGLAPSSAAVTLSVNDVEQQTVVASKAGNWTGTVTIPSPEDYNTYIVRATCVSNGVTMQQSAEVTYQADEATMTGFTLYYNEHSVTKTCDLMETNGVKPKVYFVPGTQFNFEITFDHPEKIDHLYVTSTRNNEVKYLEAFYDETRGAFVTNGYFDENNNQYVPGVLSIEYTKNVPAVNVDSSYDWSIFDNQVDSRTDDTVVFSEITETDCYAQIDLGSIYTNLQDVFIDASISVYDEVTDGNLGDWLGVFKELDKLSSYVVPGEDGESYLLSMDYSNPYSYVMLLRDASGSKFVKLILKNSLENTENMDTAWTLTQVSGALSTTNTIASVLLKQHEIETNMDALRDEVLRTSYATPEQRQEALKQVDMLEKDQSYFALITTVLPLIVASAPLAVGATMAAPAILFTAILGIFTAVAPMFWEIRTAQIKGEKVRVNFVVDPSGYVYDAATQERLEGVKVTVYYIPYDESEDFWYTVPSNMEYGVFWDASEYDQENPLYTNADGKYAWDVPEGWWRIKCEKAGYETTWSDWVPVPPPQTELNIGMTSLNAYTLTGTAVSWNGEGDELICLYSGMTEDEIGADIAAGAAGARYTARCSEAVQNADGKRYDLAFRFAEVEAGDYILAIYKPGNYTLVTATVTVSGDADLGEFALQLNGDVSGDGKVNTMDLIRLMKHISGVEVEMAPGSADVNGDGKINTMDLIRLMKLVNGETV